MTGPHVIANLDVKNQKRRFKNFLPVQIGKYECTALIDSGNSWRSAISEAFAKHLGIVEAKTIHHPPQVISAKKDITVTVLGEMPQPLKLMVRGMDKVYPFQPAIVRALHTAINLSGPWLKTQGWDDLHSQGCMSIAGHRIPLVDHSAAKPSVSGIFALKDLTIEARMGRNITALVPNVRGKQASPGLGCFETGRKLHQVGVHTGPAVLTQVQQDGTAQLLIINMTNRDVVIKAGTSLGTITGSEEDLAYVASMVQKDPGPTTQKKKKEAYIQNFVRRVKAKAGKVKKIKTAKLTQEQKRQWILETFDLET